MAETGNILISSHSVVKFIVKYKFFNQKADKKKPFGSLKKNPTCQIPSHGEESIL